MAFRFHCILTCLAFVASLSCSAAQAGAQPVFPDGRVPSLAPLIEDVTPAVVNIAVMSASPEEDNPLMQDPFFRRFFGLPDRPEPQLSAGSGVIVDAQALMAATSATLHIAILSPLIMGRRIPDGRI